MLEIAKRTIEERKSKLGLAVRMLLTKQINIKII